MLDIIKKAMRITHNALDSDIQHNINACLMDMERVGIKPYLEDGSISDNELIIKACEIYCKWQYDYLQKGEQFQKNYELLRNALSMAGEFNVQ